MDLAKLKNSPMESSFFSCLDVSHLDGFRDSAKYVTHRYNIRVREPAASSSPLLFHSAEGAAHVQWVGVGDVAEIQPRPQRGSMWTAKT